MTPRDILPVAVLLFLALIPLPSAAAPEPLPVIECRSVGAADLCRWVAGDGRPVFTTWTVYTLTGRRLSVSTTNDWFEVRRPEETRILQMEPHVPGRKALLPGRAFLPAADLSEPVLLPYDEDALWRIVREGGARERGDAAEAYQEMLRYLDSIARPRAG